MRPYADRMLELMARHRAGRAARVAASPLLERRETVENVAILAVTADRGLAGAFNAQVLRRGVRAHARELEAEGQRGRLLRLRQEGAVDAPLPPAARSWGSWTGFTDRPVYADAQAVAHASPRLYDAGRSTASSSSTTRSCRRSSSGSP